MNNNNFINFQKWFKFAVLEKKMEALEFLINENKSLTINLEESKTDYIKSELITTVIKGIYQGKKSFIELEKIDDSMIEHILDVLKKQIEISNFKEKDFIFEGSSLYPEIIENNFDFSKIELERKKNLLFELEKELLKNSYCKRIESISYSETYSKKKIINSKGLKLEQKTTFAEIYVVCIFQRIDHIYEFSKHFLVKKFDQLNVNEYAKIILEEGEKKIYSKSIKSNTYSTVFSNKTFARLLESFSSIFNGINAYRNLTKLKDKINKKIASSKVTIIDNPICKEAYFNYKFDDEGVACCQKKIVDKGIFKEFIHNLKTSYIFNVKPKGNFFNNSIVMSNCYLEKGQKKFYEMIQVIEKGIFIDKLIGLHAGINEITGDFSLQAEGFFIEKGKILSPVNMIVVSGNFFDILQELKDISDDFVFTVSGYGSASVFVGSTIIAGEN
jgi:PmbA protein